MTWCFSMTRHSQQQHCICAEIYCMAQTTLQEALAQYFLNDQVCCKWFPQFAKEGINKRAGKFKLIRSSFFQNWVEIPHAIIRLNSVSHTAFIHSVSTKNFIATSAGFQKRVDLSVSSPDEPSLREESEAITFSASALIAMFIYILEGNLICWEQPLNISEPALPEENHSATNHREI